MLQTNWLKIRNKKKDKHRRNTNKLTREQEKKQRLQLQKKTMKVQEKPEQKETNRINSEQMKQFELIKEDGRRKSKSTKL